MVLIKIITEGIMTRDDALLIIKKNVNNQNLIRHMLATESVMKDLAVRFN